MQSPRRYYILLLLLGLSSLQVHAVSQLSQMRSRQKKTPYDQHRTPGKGGGKTLWQYLFGGKTISQMNYAELMQLKKERLAENDTAGAITSIEQILLVCDDLVQLEALTLELADLLFKQGTYERALQVYNEFIDLYPASTTIERATYCAIKASNKLMLTTERDQTQTEQTLKLCTAYLANERFALHRDEIGTIEHECLDRLAHAELSVHSFYCKRKDFKAAKRRLEKTKELYAQRLPALGAELGYLGGKLALAQHDLAAVEQELVTLWLTFPESDWTMRLAQEVPHDIAAKVVDTYNISPQSSFVLAANKRRNNLLF